MTPHRVKVLLLKNATPDSIPQPGSVFFTVVVHSLILLRGIKGRSSYPVCNNGTRPAIGAQQPIAN